jgi:hypothetical protein
MPHDTCASRTHRDPHCASLRVRNHTQSRARMIAAVLYSFVNFTDPFVNFTDARTFTPSIHTHTLHLRVPHGSDLEGRQAHGELRVSSCPHTTKAFCRERNYLDACKSSSHDPFSVFSFVVRGNLLDVLQRRPVSRERRDALCGHCFRWRRPIWQGTPPANSPMGERRSLNN